MAGRHRAWVTIPHTAGCCFLARRITLIAARRDGEPSLNRLVVCSISIVSGVKADKGNSAAQYRELTFRNHVAYCARHGYDY
eukprot:2440520-Prymnesium_polylepis.2